MNSLIRSNSKYFTAISQRWWKRLNIDPKNLSYRSLEGYKAVKSLASIDNDRSYGGKRTEHSIIQLGRRYYVSKKDSEDMMPRKGTEDDFTAERRKFLVGCREEKGGDLGEFNTYLANFSSLGYEWSKDDEIRELVLKKISDSLVNERLREKNIIHVPNILNQLGKSGIKATSFPRNTWKALEMSIGKLSGSLPAQDTCTVIYGLGKMGVRWENIPEKIRANLEKRIIQNRKEYDVIQMSELMKGCSYLGYRWYKNNSTRSQLFDEILTVLMPRGQSKEYADATAGFIYALGKGGIRKDDIPEKVMKVLLEEVIRNKSFLNYKNVSNIMYGLGQLGANWKDFPAEFRATMEETLILRMNEFGIRNISAILKGSVGMGYRWYNNVRLRDELCSKMIEVYGGEIDGRALATTIYFIGKGGIKQHDLPEQVFKVLLDGLAKCKSSFDAQNIANIFYGLGTIGIRWNELPVTSRTTIEDFLLLRMNEFTNLGISGLLSGSVSMGYRWFDDVRVRDEVYQRIIDLYGGDRMNVSDGRELASIIYAMGKGGIKRTDLPQELFKVLLNGIVDCKWSINAQGISNIIYGLGMIGIRWEDLSLKSMAVIEDVLLLRITEFTKIGLPGFLIGSVNMGYRWFIVEGIRDEVYKKIIEIYGRGHMNISDGRELANIIYSLGKGGAKEARIPPQVVKVLLERLVDIESSINALAISNIMYGLGSMGIHWNDIPAQPRKAMEEALLLSIKDFTSIHLSAFATGSLGLGYRWFEIDRIQDEVYQKIIELFAKERLDISNARELTNMIHCMGKGGIQKDEIPGEVLKVLLEGLVECQSSIDPRNISSIISGLRAIGIHWKDIPTPSNQAV